MRAQCARVIKNKGGGNFCSSGASEGGAEAIGANLNRPFKLGLWQHFFLAEEMAIKWRREERGSMSGGKGRTTPLRGGRF